MPGASLAGRFGADNYISAREYLLTNTGWWLININGFLYASIINIYNWMVVWNMTGL
jgi:hypothetical protein